MADKLDLAIAAGPPAVNFSPLSSLLGDYVSGRELARRAALVDPFKNGAPTLADGTPDYGAMAETYFRLGDPHTATQLANLAAQRARMQALANPPALQPSGDANLNPPQQSAPANPAGLPVFATPYDVHAAGLPSGTRFMTPDGRIKYVP